MLSPLQDLMQRVAALEERRGPDFAIAQITAIGSQEPASGPVSGDDMTALESAYYHRWRCDVQMLDGEFRPNGGVIRDVPILQSHLTSDGTMTQGLEDVTSLGHTHFAEDATGADIIVGRALENVSLTHDHELTPVPLGVADIVMLANARLGTGSYWVVIGKLDYGTLEAVVEHRAGL